MNISVCLSTLNAEPTLARCLNSVRSLADEIVIVDNGSTDRTPFIATDFNARFIKNNAVYADEFAMQKATRDWLLFLDVNDEVPAELLQELTALKAQNPTVSGYRINVVKDFNGQQIRFGKNYPSPNLRLVQKAKAKFDLNRQLQVEGETQQLNGELIHHADSSLLQNPPPFSLFGAVGNYLFKGGLSHGGLGWQISKLDAKK